MGLINDPTLTVLGAALQGLGKREQAVAANLTNIDTPGYQPQSVDFESTLQAVAAAATSTSATGMQQPGTGPQADIAMRTTDARHMNVASANGAAGSGAVRTFAGNLRNDGNTVDLESEMTALAETQIKFSAVSRLVSGKLGMIQDVASDRSS